MQTLYNILLNIILTLFPILIYFVLSCYQTLRYNKYYDIYFKILLFTSLYLSLKFAVGTINNEVLLFCNIPIVIAYLKKDYKLAIFLSIVNVLYCKYIYQVDVIIMIIKYISYFIIYLLASKRKVKSNNFLLLIAVLQGFFTSFEYFFVEGSNISTISEVFLIVLLHYIITFAILFLFNLIEIITSMYSSVKDLEKEKNIKNSLFTLTHEIKNPIAVCKGYLDMINIDNKEDALRYINIMKQEINRSLNIMTDFLQFNKIKIKPELLDISMLLDDIYDSFKLLTNNKNIKLEYNDSDEVYIEGDYNRLKQVLVNIIKNSVEAICDEGTIKMNLDCDKKYCYITIKDDGIGMNDEILSHLTEMFYTTKQKGSGLGVALSNEIIKAHEGSLKYESKENNGTKVTIKLPLLQE